MQNKDNKIWAVWENIIKVNESIVEKEKRLKKGSGTTKGEKYVEMVINKFGMCLLTNGHYIVSGSVEVGSNPLRAQNSQGERVAIIIDENKPTLVYRENFVKETPESFFDINDKIIRNIVLGLAEGKPYSAALKGGIFAKIRNFFVDNKIKN